MLVESLMDKNLKYSKDRTSKPKSKKIKEARWEYTLKCGKSLRDAIEAEDYEEVLQTLGDAYMELYLADLIDEDECDEWREGVISLMDDLDEDGIEDEIDFQLSEFYDLCDNLRVWIPLTESKRVKKPRVIKESIDRHDFAKFDSLLNQYMPPRGEGETLASQAVTAVNKLVYKWYNDGDVFDNTHYLQGWANDLSSYANWLYEHVPETQVILETVYGCYTDSEYENLLMELASQVFNEGLLSKLSQEKASGTIYDCSGPFEFDMKDGEYEEDRDWDEESLHKGKKSKVIKESKSLMQQLLDAGYPEDQIDHHESDLYVYVTPLTTGVIQKWCEENGYNLDHFCSVFKDQKTGKRMYDCAFQFDKFWKDEAREPRVESKISRKIKESVTSQRYRYFNTKFRSLKDKLSEFLKKSGIYYELSGQIADWHFAILCNEDEEKRINDWLDENNIWSAPLQSKEY